MLLELHQLHLYHFIHAQKILGDGSPKGDGSPRLFLFIYKGKIKETTTS